MNSRYPGLGTALLLLACALAAQAGAGFVLFRLWPHLDAVLVGGLANVVALGSVAAFGFWRSGESPRFATVPETGFWVGAVLSALGATVVLGELANLTTLVLPLPSALAGLFNQLTGGNPWTSLFTLSVVAPLTEEALFRGLLLRGFARRWGPGPALVLSSALFGLFHLNPWQAPSAFVAGLFLGWIFLRTGSLLAPVVAHALFNGVPVVLGWAGLTIGGYNTPLVPGAVEFQPLPWVVLGAVVLAGGLVLTNRWAPLSPPPVSDRVVP